MGQVGEGREGKKRIVFLWDIVGEEGFFVKKKMSVNGKKNVSASIAARMARRLSLRNFHTETIIKKPSAYYGGGQTTTADGELLPDNRVLKPGRGGAYPGGGKVNIPAYNLPDRP